MPVMMATVLNLGLNDRTVVALAQHSQSERFAFAAYRRLLSMFSDVVLGIERGLFEAPLHEARRRIARQRDLPIRADVEELTRLIPDQLRGAPELRDVVEGYKGIIRRHAHQGFPANPYEQLEATVAAVFKSWNNSRAKLYRAIPDDWGTAVNVQAMVFGNLGEGSATGVAFTRDPSTGERRFFCEWLPNAQGEDVVAGIRTPRALAKAPDHKGLSLEEVMHESYAGLVGIQAKLEQRFRDMQDIEFTIEAGKLYLLQTRNGKRSARASVRIASSPATRSTSPHSSAMVSPCRSPASAPSSTRANRSRSSFIASTSRESSSNSAFAFSAPGRAAEAHAHLGRQKTNPERAQQLEDAMLGAYERDTAVTSDAPRKRAGVPS